MWVPKQGWALAAINLGQVYCKSIVSLCTLPFIVLTGTVTSQQGGPGMCGMQHHECVSGQIQNLLANCRG